MPYSARTCSKRTLRFLQTLVRRHRRTAVGLLALAASTGAAADDLVKRGEYLARAGDCVACHSVDGGKPFAGGLYMDTPFGSISTPNITPDKATGIGNWTDDQFYHAMHDGIGDKGEYLYPVFPFPWYTKVTRDDVLAIKAYLFSLPPVDAPRKPLKLAFPANIRDSLLAWRTAFFKPGEFKPDPAQSAEYNRGEYLVTGLGHCGECHNHNSLFGASDWSGPLRGGEIDDWYAPNLTSNGHQGLGRWSEAQLATFLKTGNAPEQGIVLGPMKQTIDDSLHYLTDADVKAMAVYLKSVPAAGPETTPKPSEFTSKEPPGAQAYLTFCSSCHRQDGQGLAHQIPPLAGNTAVTTAGPENVIRAVLGGIEATNGLAPMPAVGAGMTDQEVADVTNYVRTAWNNSAPPTAQAGMVGQLRGKTQTLLAGNPPGGCPKIADPKLASAIQSTKVKSELKGVTFVTMLDKIDVILRQVKAADPGVKKDDLVNALTIAYCPVAESDTSLPAAQKPVAIGNFSNLVYGRLENPGKL
jgi:mono/diheme cytochrome c family protein